MCHDKIWLTSEIEAKFLSRSVLDKIKYDAENTLSEYIGMPYSPELTEKAQKEFDKIVENAIEDGGQVLEVEDSIDSDTPDWAIDLSEFLEMDAPEIEPKYWWSRSSEFSPSYDYSYSSYRDTYRLSVWR